MLAESQGGFIMTARFVIAAALCASVAVPASAQEITAQTLLDKNLEARGGADALAAIHSIRFDGRIIFPGDFELKYDETRARGGADGTEMRMNGTVQGLTYVQAYDGNTAWRINPFQGRKDPETMSADEARSVADSGLIDGVLQASRHDGSTVSYLGREDFDGTSAYKLKVTQKDGDEFTYLLDPDTFLEIKVTETRRIRGAEQTTESELGDYEKVGGVYFPMSVDNWTQGQSNQRQRVIIETATANPPVTQALFELPGSQAQPAKPGTPPPDASNKPQQPDQNQAPADKQDPSKPGKGE
jgi:hypothetical protein